MKQDFYEVNDVKINEINNRISQLENDIGLLNAIKQEFIDKERDEVFIDALADGIKYVSIRLQEYKTKDWIMCDVEYK